MHPSRRRRQRLRPALRPPATPRGQEVHELSASSTRAGRHERRARSVSTLGRIARSDESSVSSRGRSRFRLEGRRARPQHPLAVTCDGSRSRSHPRRESLERSRVCPRRSVKLLIARTSGAERELVARSPAKHACVWQSMSPGTAQSPRASSSSTSPSIAPRSAIRPTSATRSPSQRTYACSERRPASGRRHGAVRWLPAGVAS